MSVVPPLSDRSRSVWAKTDQDFIHGGELSRWLPLYQHLDDAAAVAGFLWDEWAPPSIKSTVSRAVGGDAEGRRLLVWLAGTHDVGKASPAFAVQGGPLVSSMERAGLRCDPRIADDPNRSMVRHELVSFLAIRDRLETVYGFDRPQAQRLASIAAAHHGNPASFSQVNNATALPHLVGQGEWHEVRTEFLERAETLYLSSESIESWRTAPLSQPTLVLLSGLVIVADWISSSDLFPLAPLGQFPTATTRQRANSAWAELDFPQPWRAAVDTPDAATLLAQRFGLPDNVVPHPTQAAFVEHAQGVEHPELMILEAEMGSGKTEAALLAAEILAAKFGLTGIFVGLPTQATSDGMFSRVLGWAERLGLDSPASVFLARGRAELNEEFAQKTREAYFSSISIDGDRHGRSSRNASASSENLIAHRWFNNSRRGPLSTFVVGTVDQALFAGLRSRYLMLRHLALASKVVVIDEVHAYDEYMQVFLTTVLEWLGTYGVPVIMLSATLPSSQRKQFLAAYDRGRDTTKPSPPIDNLPRAERMAARRRRKADAEARHNAVLGLIGYPAITATHHAGPPKIVTPAPSTSARPVQVGRIDDDLATLIEVIKSATAQGGNVAVLRNTVRRAQETAAALRQAIPGAKVTLAHARYLGVDRATKDRELLRAYGRNGDRPETSIVVATQVIEQSLDVDFDLMISDMAPIDLLIQRIGRLHRHARSRPELLAQPRLIVTGIDESADVPEFDAGSEYVYGRSLLLRSLAAIRDLPHITIPHDIAPLVEIVYDHTDVSFVPSAWHENLDVAERKRQDTIRDRRTRAATFALRGAQDDASLLGWVEAPDSDPDLSPPGRGTVRDGEESLEVIVLQQDEEGTLRTPHWLPAGGGIQIPDNEPPDARLTRTILGCFLRLPVGMCRGRAIDRHIDTLERAFDMPTWHTSHLLKGELVLVVDTNGEATLNEFKLKYSADDGLEYCARDDA